MFIRIFENFKNRSSLYYILLKISAKRLQSRNRSAQYRAAQIFDFQRARARKCTRPALCPLVEQMFDPNTKGKHRSRERD